jgi:hypothetical protein
MRHDMHKVVTERPRAGGVRARNQYDEELKNVDLRDPDAAPRTRAGGRKRTWGYNYKSLTDLLGPLEGYLRKNVDRPWNHVFSDICKVLRGNGVQAAHIKGHVMDYVRRDGIYFKGNKPYDLKGNSPLFSWAGRSTFYVDLYGILKVAPIRTYRSQKKEVDENYRKIGDRHFARIRGIWYEGVFQDVIKTMITKYRYSKVMTHEGQRYENVPYQKFDYPEMVFDALEQKHVPSYRLSFKYGSFRRPFTLRQLNKKDIKKLGLNK